MGENPNLGIVPVTLTADQYSLYRFLFGEPLQVSQTSETTWRIVIPSQQLNILLQTWRNRPKGLSGLDDYKSWLARRIQPAEGFPQPYGVPDAPVQITPDPATEKDIAKDTKEAIQAQSSPRQPLLRSVNVTSAGQTLDWSAHGRMTRVIIRNKGANSAWIAFDQNGPSVAAVSPSDLSWELQANEGLSIELIDFQMIGCKCASAQTATIHAIAFPTNSPFAVGNVG